MNKSFLLAQSAGYLLGECLGGAKVTTSYSRDHNDFIWELSGYPLYGTRGTGKTTCAKIFAKAVNCLDTSSPDQVRLCEGSLEKAFAHPHVYNSGHPCWHDGARSGVADFIATLLETLTMINVTNTSVTYGKCASGVMGVGQDAVRNASIQTKRVYAAFRPLPIVKDRVKLTRYINNRWITIVSHFM